MSLTNKIQLVHQWKHVGAVSTVAYSPDGTHILTGGFDGIARLYDVYSKSLVHAWEHEGIVWSVAFAPDGKDILTGSGGAIKNGRAQLYEVDSKSLVYSMEYEWPVFSVAYSPNSMNILIGGGWAVNEYFGRLGFYQDRTFVHKDIVFSVAYSPDGLYVLTGSGHPMFGGKAQLYDFPVLNPTDHFWKLRANLKHKGRVKSVAYSPDGRYILTGSGYLWGGEARLYAFSYGNLEYVENLLCSFDLLHSWKHKGWVRSVTFSPDGKHVLTGSDDKTARVYDIESGALVHSFQHDAQVFSVAYSPDGEHILTGSTDGAVRLYHACFD